MTSTEQFLALLTGSQEERDAALCVPASGEIILRRDGQIERGISLDWWEPDGSARGDNVISRLDCIATLDLASVLAELVSYRRKIAWSLAQRGQDHQGVDG